MPHKRVYGDDYDGYSTGVTTALGLLPALFGMGSMYAGLNTARSLMYSPPKRVNAFSPYPVGVDRIRRRDFRLLLRRSTRRGSVRRYAAVRRLRYKRALLRTFA